MKKIIILILLLTINGFGLYYRETSNIIDEKGNFLGRKIAILSDEGKFYCQTIWIYSIEDYNFLIEINHPCEFVADKKISIGKKISIIKEKDIFASIILNIKGNGIEKYYQFLIKSKEGFIFSNCGNKSNINEIYNILNGSNIKQIRDFLDVLLNDEENVFGLIFSDYYKPKAKYKFIEVNYPCGELEKKFSIDCYEGLKK